MIPIALREAAGVTSADLVLPPGWTGPDPADLVLDGPVVTDSREVGPGGLYVARQGEHADGHDYLPAAARAGAVAALTTRPLPDLPCLVVPDTELAFARLAREVLDRCRAAGGLRVVGITGSSGKTSTKDLMAQVLDRRGPTLAPAASYNSEIGVPLTVCRLTPEHAYLVAEMGASGVGHIEYLTHIAPPEVGVVLNVGVAHLGEFGSREAIAHTKAELVRALPADGLAVLNADDRVVAAMAEQTRATVLTVGLAAGADLRAVDVDLDDQGRARFGMLLPGAGDPVPVRLQVHGAHHVGNALAVAATARHWGMGAEEIAEALGAAGARSRWRMEVGRRADGVTIVNDAYNANPDSVRAAVAALAAFTGRRRVLVLGEMRELGEASEAEHRTVGEQAHALGIDVLLAVGAAAPAAEGFRAAGAAAGAARTVPDVAAALAHLHSDLGEGDVVLLKSSRDSGLRHLGDDLMRQDGA